MHLTSEQCKQAREWLLDCFPDTAEYDNEERIKKCCNELIERAVNKYFDGGLSAFIATCEPVNVSLI
jgi:hypothetical protein